VSSAAHGGGHRVAFAGLLVLLAWAPVPLGSNRGWSSALLVAASTALLAVWLLGIARHPRVGSESARHPRVGSESARHPRVGSESARHPRVGSESARPPCVETRDALRAVAVPLVLLWLWPAYLLAQVAPLPAGVLEALSPVTARLYAQAARAGVDPVAAISVDRSATLVEVQKTLCYVSVLTLVLALVHGRGRLLALCWTLLGSGLAVAVYGLAVHFSDGRLGLWDPRVYGRYETSVTGSYVNRNHFAGLMALATALGIGLALGVREHAPAERGWRALARVLSGALIERHGLVLLVVAVMLGALVLSGSRGGLGAFGVSVVVMLALAAATRGRRAAELAFAPWLAAAAIGAVTWLGLGATGERLFAIGLASDRGQLREISWRIIADFPLLGSGAGTYRHVFPAYKDERFGAWLYEHAHNDYLELLADQGLVGAALVGAGVLLLLRVILAGYRSRRDPLYRGILFGTLTGLLALMAHGLVDFNFHIPANAAWFFALLGIGVRASTLERGPSPSPSGAQ